MTTEKEALKKRLAELEEEARENDPKLYEAMQLAKKLTAEERRKLVEHLETEIKRREAAGA